MKQGIYRYLPAGHKLLFMFELEQIEQKVDAITLDQPFVPNFAKKAAVLFAWSTTPYRSEWKYDISAHKKSSSMWGMSARTCICPVNLSVQAPVPLESMIKS